MKKRKKSGMRMKRAFCSVTALAMVFSSLLVPQGEITANAQNNDSTNETIQAVEDTQSPYSPTQISNGDFETAPWQSFVLNGITYTALDTSASGKITSSMPNGVGEGWNTTEIQPYSGNLFEVWPCAQLRVHHPTGGNPVK